VSSHVGGFAGTVEAAKLVQSWAGLQSGSALTAAEAQARAVTARGVEEIAAQVKTWLVAVGK
jgi:hypothetical protein